MPRKNERKTGVKITQNDMTRDDICNFHLDDKNTECGYRR